MVLPRPRISGLLRATAPPPRPDLKSTKKTPLQKGTYLGALLATLAAQKEYSYELGSQNDSKMDSKMEPKVIQKGSMLKNKKTNIFCSYLLYVSHVHHLRKGSVLDELWSFFTDSTNTANKST